MIGGLKAPCSYLQLNCGSPCVRIITLRSHFFFFKLNTASMPLAPRPAVVLITCWIQCKHTQMITSLVFSAKPLNWNSISGVNDNPVLVQQYCFSLAPLYHRSTCVNFNLLAWRKRLAVPRLKMKISIFFVRANRGTKASPARYFFITGTYS